MQIRLADKSDDEKIREILKRNPVNGSITISYQREPNFFGSLDIQGKFNQVIAAEQNNRILAMGTRSIKPVFVNGKKQNIGYLGSLRVDKEYRHKGILREGYLFLKKLNQDNKVNINYSTIIEKNRLAKKILTQKKPYLPYYLDFGKLNICAIKLLKKKNLSSDIQIFNGTKKHLSKIVKFMQEEGKKKQFFPYYSQKDFNSSYLKSLNLKDFYLAFRNNEIVGILAKWDQEKFKQTIVKGYSGILKFLKPLYNIYANYKKYPRLPQINKPFHYFYCSFIVIKNNNIEIFKALLNRIYNDNVNKEYNYFILGLHERDPLSKAIVSFSSIKYESRLYIVCWDNGLKHYKKLDNRIPYIEVSTL